jgi:hypothetical protein
MPITNHLSSTPISQQDYEQHLRAMLCLTPLRTVQWVKPGPAARSVGLADQVTKSEKWGQKNELIG